MSFLELIILWLNHAPTYIVWVLQVFGCFSCLLLMHRYFGKEGLYTYNIIALIACNIQVMKAVQYPFFEHPVALGTVLFTSTYLSTDILAENYGKDAAKRAVWLGFASLLIFTCLMILTIGFQPLNPDHLGADMRWAWDNHQAIKLLFMPMPALFLAGMISYLISQMNDIWVYEWLRKKTKNSKLWLRNNISTLISCLIDNTIFSVLAWYILAVQPVSLNALLYTYILGTYIERVLVAFLDTPFLYLATYKMRHTTYATN